MAMHFRTARLITWTARIWSGLSLLLILGFIIGEGIHFTRSVEALGFVFFPLGISIGMVVSWWRERLGGAITVSSLLAFYFLHFASTGRFPQGWAWLLFAFPGVLSLFNGYGSARNLAGGR